MWVQREMGGQAARNGPHPSTLPVSADNCCWAPRTGSSGARQRAAGLQGKSSPACPGARSRVCETLGRSPAASRGGRGASRLPSTQLAGRRVARAGEAREPADAPLTLGSGPARRQQQRGQQFQERRARPAAARPVHSSPRSGGVGGGGSRAARRTSTGSAQGPGRSPRKMPGASAKFFVPLTCSLSAARPLEDPVKAIPPQPSGCSRASAGSSGQPRAAGVPPAERESPRLGLCARRLPSRGSLRGGCGGSSDSARSLSCSQSPLTCHFPPTLQPRGPAPTNGRRGPTPATQRPLPPSLPTRTLPNFPGS